MNIDFSTLPDDVRRAGLIDRLRIRWEAMTEMANDERAEAAMELVRLRIERDAARQHVLRLLAEFRGNAKERAAEWGWPWEGN